MLFPEIIGDGLRRKSPENRVGFELSLNEFVTPRKNDVADRPKFACAFVNNPEPSRMRLISAMESCGSVDVYGLAGQGPVPNKFDVASQYRFQICPENINRPGYVTEKIFDAWACGCIPIWMGLDSLSFLNPDAFIDATYKPLENVVGDVHLVNSSRELLEQVGGSPLLLRRPSLDSIFSDLRGALEE